MKIIEKIIATARKIALIFLTIINFSFFINIFSYECRELNNFSLLEATFY